MASYLLDTNVVLRLMDSQDPQHDVCRGAVDTLITRREELCLAPQVLVEFWVVATRPVGGNSNGFGLQPDETDLRIEKLCGFFPLRHEHPGIFEHWRDIVKRASVRGKRAHDARLAAFMRLHNIDAVLTLNPNDFKGFGVKVVQPKTLTSNS